MDNDDFNFSKWINDSFLEVAKKAIRVIERKKTTDNFCFYVTFITADKGVIIPDTLLVKYPEIMTIVLENQFDDLVTDENGFSVFLSFQGVLTKLYIPWTSILSFVEKSLDLQMLFSYSPNFKSQGSDKITNFRNLTKKTKKVKQVASIKELDEKSQKKKSTAKKTTKKQAKENVIKFPIG